MIEDKIAVLDLKECFNFHWRGPPCLFGNQTTDKWRDEGATSMPGQLVNRAALSPPSS